MVFSPWHKGTIRTTVLPKEIIEKDLNERELVEQTKRWYTKRGSCSQQEL